MVYSVIYSFIQDDLVSFSSGLFSIKVQKTVAIFTQTYATNNDYVPGHSGNLQRVLISNQIGKWFIPYRRISMYVTNFGASRFSNVCFQFLKIHLCYWNK